MREVMIDSVNRAVRFAVDHCKSKNPNAIFDTQDIADFLIARDVVPVVRCKECKHWDNDFLWCDRKNVRMAEDDYCSYGERGELNEV